MPTLSSSPRESVTLPDNAMARAIEAVQKIDAEAKQKKMVQLESLQMARAAIQKRVDELNHQVAQIDAVVASVSGTSIQREKHVRKNWEIVRGHVVQWMANRKGQKFSAGDLIRAFPELEGTVMTVLFKSLLQEGKVKADISEGIRRSKYFVAE